MTYVTAVLRGKSESGTVEIDAGRTVNLKASKRLDLYGDPSIQVRNGGDFTKMAFYLDDEYDWVLAKDSGGTFVLIPLKKNDDGGE